MTYTEMVAKNRELLDALKIDGDWDKYESAAADVQAAYEQSNPLNIPSGSAINAEDVE